MDAKGAFTLRQLGPQDAERVTELISDWDVVRWLSMPPYPYVVRDADEFIARTTAAAEPAGCRTAAIEIAGQLAGVVSIDLRAVGHNLGFWLGRAYWRQGIMTAAATELTRDFFATSAFEVLTSGYFSSNEASWAIQRRLGFRVVGEGTLFNRSHGKHLPLVETALSRELWERRAQWL
jgi:8-oxo-dGTP diphosphatase